MSNRSKSNDAEPPAAESAVLARIRKQRRDRLRLDEAWEQVQGFLPADEAEEEILEFLTDLLGGVERWCNPGEAATVEEYEAASSCADYYRWFFGFRGPELPLDLIAAVLAAEGGSWKA